MISCKRTAVCCLSQCRNLNNYPCKGCAQTHKWEITARSNLNLIGCLTPTVDKANASRINSRWQSREETISDQTKSISAPYKPRLLNCEAKLTIMVGQDDKQKIEWMIIGWCCIPCLYSFG